jgi:ABC-type sugar transport system ATPase subunit
MPRAIEVVDVTKSYPGVRALDRVSFDAHHGEIHAVLGENGAGKSTLVKILAGLEHVDTGEIRIEGETVRLATPRIARQRGVRMIPQDVDACRQLSVGRNVLLGLEAPVVRRAKLSADDRRRVEEAFRIAGVQLDPDLPSADLSVPELRLAQIAKALATPGGIVLCDEPTAVLSEADAEVLLDRLISIRDQAHGAIVYISHRLSEVLRVADRITVLRDGRNVGTFARADVDRERLIKLMAKPQQERAGRRPAAASGTETRRGAGSLAVDGLSSGRYFDAVSLTVEPGGIVGLAGVQGAGHGALLSAIAGRRGFEAGTVKVDGEPLAPGDLRAAARAGIGLVPADRREAAIVQSLSVRENVALPASRLTGRFGLRLRGVERRRALSFAGSLDIRGAGTEALAGQLSGGNQQKVALARVIGSEPRFLLLEEPTQGIDVRAKSEIRQLVVSLARDQGLGVLVASSEFEDLLGFADEIHVMRLGRVVATVDGTGATYSDLLHHALP